MRYLRLSEILYLHGRIIEKSGGISGIMNLGGLESAIALPKQFFGGTELYPSLIEKAAVFCFSIVANHPFIDGNKRVGHASMETFLILNGTEITASVDEQTKVMQIGDVRIISASNRNLSQEVKSGRFREYLYYRLADVVITMPPLRDMRDAIIPLAVRFLQDTAGL
jgi:death-on-curing protein